MRYKAQFVVEGKVHRFESNDKGNLYSQAASFLQKLNIKFTERELNDQIDRQSKMGTSLLAKVGISGMLHGAMAIMSYTSGNAASNEEIARRSNICKSCPLSTRAALCGPCGASQKLANMVNQIRAKKGVEAPLDPEVKNRYCSVCSCSLALMLVTKMEDFHEKPEMNQSRPDYCWLKTTSTNYLP